MSFWQQLKISHRYAQLPASFYTKIQPDPLTQCRWGSWNSSLARSLGLPETPDDTLLHAFSGVDIPPQLNPIAMKYAGHQFGVYNPDLGMAEDCCSEKLPINKAAVLICILKVPLDTLFKNGRWQSRITIDDS